MLAPELGGPRDGGGGYTSIRNGDYAVFETFNSFESLYSSHEAFERLGWVMEDRSGDACLPSLLTASQASSGCTYNGGVAGYWLVGLHPADPLTWVPYPEGAGFGCGYLVPPVRTSAPAHPPAACLQP